MDTLAEERGWLAPYNYVQNKPILIFYPTEMLDDYGLDVHTGELTFLKETDGADVIYTGEWLGKDFKKDGGSKTFTEGSSNIKEVTTTTNSDGEVIDARDASASGIVFKKGFLREGLEVMEFISIKSEKELIAQGFENKNGRDYL